MSALRPVLEVARWEFRRYLKPKEQVISMVVMLAMLMLGVFFSRLGSGPSTIELAVVGAEHLALPPELGRFRLEFHDASGLDRLLGEVENRDRQAVLVITSTDAGELIARQTPGWRSALAGALSEAALRRRLETSGLDLAHLAALQRPFELTVHERAPRAGPSERVAAFIALGLGMVGFFIGLGYIFISVTGEKQNRLSEQVISAIPPQAWIDGKILGLGAAAIVGVLNFVVTGLIGIWLGRRIWGWSITLPTTVERPDLLILAITFIFMGYLFWFAFLAAVAAIVDDPHTSNRNQLMMLPMLAAVPAAIAVVNPDAVWMQVLSIAPPTSSVVLPARLLVSEVPAWHVLLAAALLVAAIAFMRRMAGRVFRLGMLMYGKEPSWAEIRRWLREA